MKHEKMLKIEKLVKENQKGRVFFTYTLKLNRIINLYTRPFVSRLNQYLHILIILITNENRIANKCNLERNSRIIDLLRKPQKSFF